MKFFNKFEDKKSYVELLDTERYFNSRLLSTCLCKTLTLPKPTVPSPRLTYTPIFKKH